MDVYDDELVKINSMTVIDGDIKSLLSNQKDEERIKKIKDIKLEYEIFNVQIQLNIII